MLLPVCLDPFQGPPVDSLTPSSRAKSVQYAQDMFVTWAANHSFDFESQTHVAAEAAQLFRAPQNEAGDFAHVTHPVQAPHVTLRVRARPCVDTASIRCLLKWV